MVYNEKEIIIIKRMRKTRKKLHKKSRRRSRGGSDFLVEYPSERVHNGKFMTKQETNSAPKISFKNAPGKLYTIMMWDPDASAKPSWIHWIVTNIETPQDISKKTILEYQGPNPPSGTHRYFIGLFEQSGILDIDTPKLRGSFDYLGFIQKNNLLKMRQVYFMCKYSEYNYRL